MPISGANIPARTARPVLRKPFTTKPLAARCRTLVSAAIRSAMHIYGSRIITVVTLEDFPAMSVRRLVQLRLPLTRLRSRSDNLT
jgi:hypothetical protein